LFDTDVDIMVFPFRGSQPQKTVEMIYTTYRGVLSTIKNITLEKAPKEIFPRGLFMDGDLSDRP
jgi:hypothetical protein